jgi:D-glycero-D-manno-heptose 1,7-bisphosphate phosphatase
MNMNKKGLILLDRDGVICEEKHFLSKKEDFELIPRVGEAIKLLNENGYRVAVVTNQAGIARGMFSEGILKDIHDLMENMLKEFGAWVDKIYYCPHHPKAGVNPEYTRVCECRKPQPGMLLQAKKDFGLEDLSESYMIGDRTGDIKAGNLAGCKTIILKTGYGGNDGFNDAVPDFEARDLYEAVVKIILKRE